MSDWLANKTPENVLNWISSDKTFCLVAETSNKEIVGFSCLKNDKILLNYLSPGSLHKGIGKAMLSYLEDHAKTLGEKELRVNSKITARAFYTRNGFVPSGEPKYVGDILGEFPLLKFLG